MDKKKSSPNSSKANKSSPKSASKPASKASSKSTNKAQHKSSKASRPAQKQNSPFYEAFDKKKKFVPKAYEDLWDDESDYDDFEEIAPQSAKPSHARNAKATSSHSSDTPSHGKATLYQERKGDKKTYPEGAPRNRYVKPAQFEIESAVIKRIAKQFASEPACGVFGRCGGCQLQHLTYEGQLKYKDHKIGELLEPFGKVAPIVGMDNPKHYRNKVLATFGYDKNGKFISGIYEEHTHKVIPVKNCLIQDQKANAIIDTIKSLMPSFKLTPYDEDYDTGFLRHVLIRKGHVSGEIMVVIIGGNPIFPSKNNFVKALVKVHPEITTVVFNVNNRRTSMVLGPNETILYGKGYIEDTLCDTVFRLSPKSFYQINSVQTEKLYNKAIELAGLTGKENVLDAYCGIGTIGLIASHKAGEVIGVELNKDAVKDAIINAKNNHITNAKFFQADASDFMLELEEAGESLDVVFMDPPRSGSDERFLSSLVKLGPKTVVYVSCGPESLARDLKYLVNNGYKVKEMHAYDMFPWTEHVEAIILMTRSGSVDKK